MKRLESSLLLAILLVAGASQAEENANAAEGLGLMPGVRTAPDSFVTQQAPQPAQAAPPAAAPTQTLTFPPSNRAGSNQVQYPGAVQNGLQFPNQAYTQQQSAYPYNYYSNYGYPAQSYGYGYPYAQNYYNPYGMYRANPYAMRPMTPVQPKKKETHPWGDTRYIWPDFYTDFTGDVWDKMINAPYDIGRMPGGWRFPSFSSPDPVTVSDAIANQVPPFAEEAGNMVPIDDAPNVLPF